MSELADLWSDRPERERRKASGTAEFPREVPDRVIDAPIPDVVKLGGQALEAPDKPNRC